jgi:hypothetical protein
MVKSVAFQLGYYSFFFRDVSSNRKFRAYFGNQQFTSSHLAFVNCKTALQIHWDWAWTMQDVIIESCQQGIVVTGGVSALFHSPFCLCLFWILFSRVDRLKLNRTVTNSRS